MLFFERTKRLVQEFLLFKKYKQIHPALAVFTGIFLIPFALLFFIQLGFTFLASILFTLFEAPIKYLHGILKDEVKESKTAVQVIVYYFSWPVLFAFYVFYALFTLMVFFNYLETVLVGYIANLGGFKFHISPMEQDISKDCDPNRCWQKNVLAGIFVATSFTLVMLGVILLAAALEPTVGVILIGLYMLFCCVYVPIAFRELKKEPAPEAPQPEQSEETKE